MIVNKCTRTIVRLLVDPFKIGVSCPEQSEQTINGKLLPSTPSIIERRNQYTRSMQYCARNAACRQKEFKLGIV